MVFALAFLFSASSSHAADRQTVLKFDFSSAQPAAGWLKSWTKILPTTAYSKEASYGFEPGAKMSAVDRAGGNALLGDFITSDQPFLFSSRCPREITTSPSRSATPPENPPTPSRPSRAADRRRWRPVGLGRTARRHFRQDESQRRQPCPRRHETIHTYGWYLRKYIADTKAKGTTLLVCSLVPRRTWRDRKIVRSNDYAKWAAEVAKTEKVRFIDLNEMIARRYDELGPEKVEPLFGDPHTDTSLSGAKLNAECVVASLKQFEDCPLRDFLSATPTKIEKPATGKN